MPEEINNSKKINIYSLWICVELALLLLDICLPFMLGFDRLDKSVIVTLAIDWMGMFTLITILNSCIRGRKSTGSSSFMALTIVTFFILFFEVGTWIWDNSPKYRTFNYLTNIVCNVLMLVNTICYLQFVCESLGIDRKKVSGLYQSVMIMTFLGIIAEILNCRFGFFYVVDESGTYIRNAIGSIFGYIPFVYNTGCCCVLALKQNIPFGRKCDYMSYVIVPLVVSVWYSITGMPPTLYAATFITLLIIYGNIYVSLGQEMQKTLLENARIDAELAWQRNQLTRSQIKPHFIFNCIGSIEQLCRVDSEEARQALHRFAKYLRVNMDSMSEQSLVPFDKELEHIHNYVWLEQMRFEDDLQYEENIEATSFAIPPLSIQPIVENAIKHGMMGKEDGVLTVSVSVCENDKFYEIKIEDNGNGFDENAPKDDGRSHVGITNVRESLKNTVGGDLIINSTIGRGTVATILIPKTESKGDKLNENSGC